MKNVPDNMSEHEYSKMLRNCRVRGISCEYGICDECPNTRRDEEDDEDQEKEKKKE